MKNALRLAAAHAELVARAAACSEHGGHELGGPRIGLRELGMNGTWTLCRAVPCRP
jgi:hypothetical protein